jgi:MFS family permease
VIEAAGVLLAGFAAGQVAVVTGGALLGGTFVGIVALGVGAARRAAGINQDRAVGWMTASFGLGQLLGPAVAGRLAQMTGSFAAPSLVAALLLLLGIALLWGVEEQ